ncbi:MAG: hypothetical protein CVU39_14155 [Chloroflexi bacterium HGW-Chloroflexi-10]|nr:MAG: hypothetical protein CVU39_14155 [Chloroflexi bacterium HGW-Chloroflexi-10]
MTRLKTFLLIQQRKRKRNAGKIQTRRHLRRGFTVLLTIFFICFAVLPVAAGWYAVQITHDLPAIEWLEISLDPENGLLLNPTVLLDRSEQNELYRLENPGNSRRFLPIDPNNAEFHSPYLVQYTVAAYQPDFWESPGYTTQWFEASTPVTIAEKLVDRLLLWQDKPGLQRSIRMRILAAQIVREYGRTQVLEWFINSTPYGHLSIGADNAAQLYFGKGASQLSAAEAAMLVSVSLTPALNPLDSIPAARENQQAFLTELKEVGILTAAEYEQIILTEVSIQEPPTLINEQYRTFSRMVINQLYEKYGRDRVELGGFRVITSLDAQFQEAVNCTLQTQLERLSGQESQNLTCAPERLLPGNTSTLQVDNLVGSAIIFNPNNGQILAFVGDMDGHQETAILTTHQAGSSLTPLLAVNAFARGFSPASQVWDIPDSLPTAYLDESIPASDYRGPLRLRTALTNDIMPAINRLYQQLGGELIWRSASSFGLSNAEAKAGDDLLFQGESANILEIAQLYSTFATLGTRYGVNDPDSGQIQPVSILQVESYNGQDWYTHITPDSQAIVSEQVAFLVHDMLQDEYERRLTLGHPNLLEIGRPAGAKFGTVHSNQEVWTAGYTPQYTTVVWMGSPTQETTLDPKIAGAVWYALMQWLHQDEAVQTWQTPSGISEITVCNLSGLLPTRECPSTVIERFLDGTQPVGYDNLYKNYQINRETNLLATVFTPPDLIEERTYMIIPDEAQGWALQTGILLPPQNYDAIQAPLPSDSVQLTAPGNYSFLSGTVSISGVAAGENFVSYRVLVGQGLNPQSWQQIGDEVNTARNKRLLAEWDTTAFSDGLYALRLQVIRSDQSFELHTIQVSVDNTSPIARIAYPNANTSVPRSIQSNITLQVDVSDNLGILEVEWVLDGRSLGKLSEMPYSFPVNVAIGTHTLAVNVTDLAGNLTTSSEIRFEVTQ